MPHSSWPAPTPLSPPSLHDALPISGLPSWSSIGTWASSCGEWMVCSWKICRRWLRFSMKPPVPGVDASRKVRGETSSALPAVAITSDRKSTRLNSSHPVISYAAFILACPYTALPSFPTRRSSDLRLALLVLDRNLGKLLRRVDGLLVEDLQALVEVLDEAAGAGRGRLEEGEGRDFKRVARGGDHLRSEEHTSELQSPRNLVCRIHLGLPLHRSPLLPYTTLFRSPACPPGPRSEPGQAPAACGWSARGRSAGAG